MPIRDFECERTRPVRVEGRDRRRLEGCRESGGSSRDLNAGMRGRRRQKQDERECRYSALGRLHTLALAVQPVQVPVFKRTR